MANKVIIGILIFLVIISGGVGAYAYLLNQQVEALGVQLEGFQQEQSARISAISGEVAALRWQTMDRIDALKTEIDGVQTEIGNLRDEIGATRERITSLEEEIDEVSAEMAHSRLDAVELYQKARQAAVRIGDGDRLIGSGFIVDDEGHVITANHVVEQLSTVYVTLADGRSSTATIIGTCEASDVAVLRLDNRQLSVEPLHLADSAQVRIGESVIAIGNPFNLTETLTSGIVSQINRFVQIKSNDGEHWVANLIQYDAPVNPGNSGGPLLNAGGEVIGLVIARVDPERGEGIYYAVSSNKVKRVAARLIESGSFDYPWVGINVSNISPRMAQDRALETTSGALVQGILPDSPAQDSEIEADDVIVAIDSVAVQNVGDLTSYLGEHKSPGDQSSLTIYRHAVKMEITVEVGKRPA